MATISMQAFADSLGVSRITVWKALNGRAGVSDELRRRILEQAAAQGVIPSADTESAAKKRVISVAVSRPDSSLFWMQIIHHIAKELSLQGVDLMYTYLPGVSKNGYALPASLGDVTGLIVINVYDAAMLRMLSALPQPKVFLDTVPSVSFEELDGDVVMLEGRDTTRKITERLLDTGRRTLGFIGDVTYAQTNVDRYLGFTDALARRNVKPEPRYLFTGSIGVNSYYEQIAQYLEQLDALPDAFVCASDFVAHLVARILKETNRQRPDGFLLTGFDNNHEYDNIAGRITTVDVQTTTLGSRLARRILFLTDFPKASHEIGYVTSDVLFREPL